MILTKPFEMMNHVEFFWYVFESYILAIKMSLVPCSFHEFNPRLLFFAVLTAPFSETSFSSFNALNRSMRAGLAMTLSSGTCVSNFP